MILSGILFLSLLDLAMTIGWIESGQATEGNPVMAYLLTIGGYPLFAVVKVWLVGAGVWLLDRFWHNPLARGGAWIAILAYAWIVGYHAQAIAA